MENPAQFEIGKLNARYIHNLHYWESNPATSRVHSQKPETPAYQSWRPTNIAAALERWLLKYFSGEPCRMWWQRRYLVSFNEGFSSNGSCLGAHVIIPIIVCLINPFFATYRDSYVDKSAILESHEQTVAVGCLLGRDCRLRPNIGPTFNASAPDPSRPPALLALSQPLFGGFH